jgi:AcrR family transcriptional regulator
MDKTHRALRSAFTKLVGERRYDEIKVADILVQANVGKSTFYEHFRNKDDLLKSMMGGMLRTLARSSSGNYDDDRLRRLVVHFWKNRRLGRAVFGVPLVISLRRTLAALIEDELAAGKADRGNCTARRLNAVQIAAGHLDLLHAWLSGEVTAEPEDIVAALRATAYPTSRS